jgi:hypothetical protein
MASSGGILAGVQCHGRVGPRWAVGARDCGGHAGIRAGRLRRSGAAEAKHRQSTCPDRLRGQGHLTTTLHKCSDNRVEAHMPQSDALDTKHCAEPVWAGRSARSSTPS